MPNLQGKKVAILATDGFEQVELTTPKQRLEQAGATVEVIAPKSGKIRGWKFKEWGEEFPVDREVTDARVDDYDALVLPGGQINPDILRLEEDAVTFVRDFYKTGKPLAAVCHGPWMLIEAGIVRGRKVTSWPSLQTDLSNAGADWVDQEVVVDNGLITSRKPDDLEAFSSKIVEEIGEGRHQRRSVA